MNGHQPFINDFANRSFRDFADQDYISARVAYRNEFDQQFRWCALQAIEKYLKAILLYNRISSKGLGHDLEQLLKRTQSVTDLEFTVPADVEDFIEYISIYGADRYLSHPTHLKNTALLTLDKSVWYVRRYCEFMRQVINVDGVAKELFEINKQKIRSAYYEDQPHKFQLFDGYLEKIIKERRPAYDALVWKNFFFGRAKKHAIRNYPFRGSSQNPTHALHAEVFSSLASLVDFPKAVKKQFGD